MADTEAQAEALLREKPKRIIQNQTLIQLVTVAVNYASLVLPMISMWLIFGITPLGPLMVLAVWMASSIAYVIGRVYVHYRYNVRREDLRSFS